MISVDSIDVVKQCKFLAVVVICVNIPVGANSWIRYAYKCPLCNGTFSSIITLLLVIIRLFIVMKVPKRLETTYIGV